MSETNGHSLAAKRSLAIAIDGAAGSGKSTLGKGLARSLGCRYLDTGLMYRALTAFALDSRIRPSDTTALVEAAKSLSFRIDPSDPLTLVIEGRAESDELRAPRIDAAVSEYSAVQPVRSELVRRQRELAEDGCIVMVGRDIGTAVLPQADLKIWLTASSGERARRRSMEALDGGQKPSDVEVERHLSTRDEHDSTRAASPLRMAQDAVVLSTEGRTPQESLAAALDLVRQATESKSTQVISRESER